MQEQRRRPAPPVSTARDGSPPSWRHTWWIGLALVVVTIAAFVQVRHFDFVNFDDQVYVTNNPHVRAGLTWAGVVWAFTSSYAANWHPMTWLSHMLDVELFGLNPGPPHVVSLLLHVANTVLVWLVFRRLTGSTMRSAVVAALFGVHPLHVESVAWVAERKDVLSAFFGLLTLWTYAGYVRNRSFGRYISALCFFVLGLMSKPMLVTLPFVMLLLDFWPLRRIDGWADPNGGATVPWRTAVAEKAPFVLLAVVASVVTAVVQHRGGSVTSLEVVPLDARLTNMLTSYANYVWSAIWPAKLAAFYPRPVSSQFVPAIVAGVALVGVTSAAVLGARRRPYLTVGWFWFLGMLVPVIGLVSFGAQARADRYMYLPILGLLLAGIWGLTDLAERWHVPRRALGAIAVVIIIACASVTSVQAGYWSNDLALWQHALDVTSANSRAHANLGTSLAARGRQTEAADEYRKAIAIEPNMPQAHNNLGLALVALGNRDEAIEQYRQAIALQPDYGGAHNNLGVALKESGKIDEAIVQYKEALRSRPDDAQIHNNLGAAFAAQDRLPEATREFLEAVRLEPARAEWHFAAGIAYAQQGADAEAIQQLKIALGLDPKHDGARRALSELERPPSVSGRGRGGN